MFGCTYKKIASWRYELNSSAFTRQVGIVELDYSLDELDEMESYYE